MNIAGNNVLTTDLSDSNLSLMDNSFIAQFQGISNLTENFNSQQLPTQNSTNATQHLKNLVSQIIKHQQVILDQVFDGDTFPDDFPVLTPQKSNYDPLLIVSHLLKQHQIVAMKYIQIKNHKQDKNLLEKDNDYNQMMTDKLQADNNLYKMSLQKSELVIKNFKTENEYMQKQMQQLRQELERQTQELLMQQQEKFILDSQRDQERIKTQVQSYQELKVQLNKSENSVIQLEQQNAKLQRELDKLKDEQEKQQSELETYKTQTKIFQGQNQNKLLKKIETITNKSSIQLNIHSNQTSQLFNNKIYNSVISSGNNSFTDCNSQQQQALPTDIFNQQIAMAQLNDQILNEWKKNQREINISEKFMHDFSEVKSKADDIKKEGSLLKIENSELNEKYNTIKIQFGQLLDKFQNYILQNEQQNMVKDQNYQKDTQKHLQEQNFLTIQLSQKDNQLEQISASLRDTQEQIILFQNENINLRTQLSQKIIEHSNDIKNKQQNISNTENFIVSEDYMNNLLDIVNQSDQIFKKLSQDYIPLQQYHESSINQSIQQDQSYTLNPQQLLEHLRANQNFIQQLIDSICQSISQSIELSEFKDLSENILRSQEKLLDQHNQQQPRFLANNNFNIANDQIVQQQQQYFYDLNSLLQNVMKCYLNKEIQTTILQRNMQFFIDLINQKQSGEVILDLNGLVKQNMEELLQLRIENNQMQTIIQDLQQQFELSIQNQHSYDQQNQFTKTQIINPDSNHNLNYTLINELNSHKTFDSYQTTSQNLKVQLNNLQNDTAITRSKCQSCFEMQQLYDELEKQIYESKSKLEASTNIITTLEQQVEECQQTIIQIVQLFEKKKIDKDSYPIKILQDYARDKVKRLLNKYENVRKNNEEFQGIVIKELESLNLELSMKRLKKKGISELDQKKDSVNEQLNNMDKFKQLFTLLKGIITERQQDKEQSKDKLQDNKHYYNYPRKMSEITQASSQYLGSQTQTQLQPIIQQINSNSVIDRRQSIISQYDNLSNMQTQRLINGISQPKLNDYDEQPVQLITDREKHYKNHHQAQSSLGTEASDKYLNNQIRDERQSLTPQQILNTFGKQQSLNTNSSRQISSAQNSNKENNKNSANPQIINNQCVPKVLKSSQVQVLYQPTDKHCMDTYYEKVSKNQETRSKSVEQNYQLLQKKKIPSSIRNTLDAPLLTKTFENRPQTTCNYEPCQTFSKNYDNSARAKDSSHRSAMNHTVLIPSQQHILNSELQTTTYDNRSTERRPLQSKLNQMKKLQLNCDQPQTALEARLSTSSNIRRQFV